MEYYIITVCQSNDILSLILILKCAPPPTEIHFTARTSTHTHAIIELVTIDFVDRKGGVAFSEHFWLERRATSDCPIETCNIIRFFFTCPNFMDVHVLLICWAFQGWRTHRLAPGIQRYLTGGRQNLKWKYIKSGPLHHRLWTGEHEKY